MEAQPKFEARRIVERFKTFLHYDILSNTKFENPFDLKLALIYEKDAISLAIIHFEEMAKLSEDLKGFCTQAIDYLNTCKTSVKE